MAEMTKIRRGGCALRSDTPKQVDERHEVAPVRELSKLFNDRTATSKD